uniref:Uncharacterized protein n=1 Tax=Arundo donax TaxID=35708 RepID=A0A0A9AMI3_ARUDO
MVAAPRSRAASQDWAPVSRQTRWGAVEAAEQQETEGERRIHPLWFWRYSFSSISQHLGVA